jgi:hypothetical protein
MIVFSFLFLGQHAFKDPVMRSKYIRLKGKKGAKRAIIAIARNLLIRIRRMLLGREPYVVGVC